MIDDAISTVTAQAWGLGAPAVQFYGESPAIRPLTQPLLTYEEIGQLGTLPNAYGERIDWSQSQRRIEIYPGSATRAWLLARVDFSDFALGVIERIGCYLRADALDDDGTILQSTIIDGQNPTLGAPLAHPNPAVDPLDFAWRLTDLGYSRDVAQRNVNGVTIGSTGFAVIPTWDDARYGWDSHAQAMQLQFHQETRLGLWLAVSGGVYAEAPAWRIQACGHLSGWAQTWGPRNRAFRSAMTRS